MRSRKNFFIVVEGIDFTGKTTQSELLCDRLRNEKVHVSYFDFPQYKKRSAVFVEDYLVGEFGDATKLDPKIASVFYAMDRFSTKQELLRALARGVVVSNRYSTSNFGHQAAKYSHPQDKIKFWKWVQEFEYGFLGLPRPNIVIILMLPLAVSVALGKKRKDPKYVSTHGKTTDMHQKSIQHLKKARASYLLLEKLHPDLYKIVDCYDAKNKTILPPEIISDKIWDVLLKRMK